METKVTEIADGIFRLSTHVAELGPGGFTFNQFLVNGDEPLMFHTGLRKMFELNRTALSRIIPPEKLRWIAYGHFEADECGAMNEWLAVAPEATAAHGATGVMVSLNDFGQVEPNEHGSISLVVYNDGNRNVGVAVGRIVDIVSQADSQFDKSEGDTRIIAGRVTRVVNLAQVAMNA